MSPAAERRAVLVLHVAVPGVYADDLAESAAEYYGGDVLALALETLVRESVGLTVVTIPPDKTSSGDFELHAYECRIVGAEVRGA